MVVHLDFMKFGGYDFWLGDVKRLEMTINQKEIKNLKNNYEIYSAKSI